MREEDDVGDEPDARSPETRLVLPAGARVLLALIGLCAFVPLGLLLLGEPGLPKWQQYLVTAAFTPAGLILEWIAFTGRMRL